VSSELLARAYAACEAMARSHYENFPVASRLLPRAMRPHIAALYAFARVADDIADEGTASAGYRLEQLAAWRRRLHAAVLVEAAALPPHAHEDLIMIAVAHSIRSLALPIELFDDLLSAFGQDTMTSRYDSWADVLDYCRRSANPVGRLVLRIAGIDNPSLDQSSDALCTALQLTNFWQDFGRDWRADRLYVPREIADACGAHESDLAGGRMTPEWSAALALCIRHTRDRFRAGRRVCDEAGGRLGIELRLTWLGGARVLERVDRSRDHALAVRPTLGKWDVVPLLWRAARWQRRAA